LEEDEDLEVDETPDDDALLEDAEVKTWVQPKPEEKAEPHQELADKKAATNLRATLHDFSVDKQRQEAQINDARKENEKRTRELDNREAALKQESIKQTADADSLKNEKKLLEERTHAVEAREKAAKAKEADAEKGKAELHEEREKLYEHEREVAKKDQDLKADFGKLDDGKRALYLEQQALEKRTKDVTAEEEGLAKKVEEEARARKAALAKIPDAASEKSETKLSDQKKKAKKELDDITLQQK